MKLTDKILVTGSDGFIGTHLMKLLGNRGINFDIKRYSHMDINNPGIFKSIIFHNKPKAIIHLAAISNREETDKDPDLALRTNIIGSFNVMRIAYEFGIRVVVASSAATYEPDRSIYGTSKDAMEHLAHMFDNVVIARLYNVYGPGGKGVINKWIDEIYQDKSVHLNGNTTRDYIWVEDVVKVLVELADDDVMQGTWEIGTGIGTKLKDLLMLVSKAFNGKVIAAVHDDAKDEIQESHMLDKPYFEFVDLEEGIRRLVA